MRAVAMNQLFSVQPPFMEQQHAMQYASMRFQRPRISSACGHLIRCPGSDAVKDQVGREVGLLTGHDGMNGISAVHKPHTQELVF